MFKPLSVLRRRKNMNVLFLSSHGLRTHLSALRWASSRLKKSQQLTREQRHLADEIHTHSRALGVALHALLLLGRVEEEDHRIAIANVSLAEELARLSDGAEGHRAQWYVTCGPEINVQADAAVLHAIIQNLAVLCAEATKEPKMIFVRAQHEQGAVRVWLHAAWEFPFLSGAKGETESERALLGGTPGLMLSLADELARFIGGSVVLEEVAAADDDVHDGTVEWNDAAQYRISVTLRATV